ncbi:dTDP-4-dehydrorhamnose 3,5-epimerase family protein [Nocardiopsis ansamitocini]|uniref:dTDP-4-dehydrorhamnose 3,5-epimerase n=1 Tax=Nocardiopsis ansamitocini TaxID=1670832 RepID=A0A9W6P7X7_9ACTN|nr:dTDP-4-dehydrorhamnose 3,5-epimerase family protein [Nocardiopsis ansamitocini]GLU48702.1 dTDP-4-dehydrorhamnose 3,5-epimerase [Nocardiopsis ansamitocini]
MRVRELRVEGAFEFTPDEFPDDRGLFVSPFQESVFASALGHPLFPVAQTSYSVSRRGVVRGVHYTATPPGSAKYVHCPQGRALDMVVDLRVGSPTFGLWDSVVLDRRDHRAVFLPVGVGHAFAALEDDTLMAYILSGEYRPQHELALAPVDPGLGLPIPDGIDPVLSQRDSVAPTLAEALSAGLLPQYAKCRTEQQRLSPRAG